MAKEIQRQVMYLKRRLYWNKWQNLKVKYKWKCGMWLSADERHNHRPALCKRLLHNWNPCEKCNIRVVLMVRIRPDIPDAMYKKPDAWLARVIYNAMRRKNKRHCIIAAAWELCYAILHQREQCSVRVIGAVRNTQVFQMETSVVADSLADIGAKLYWEGICIRLRTRSKE